MKSKDLVASKSLTDLPHHGLTPSALVNRILHFACLHAFAQTVPDTGNFLPHTYSISKLLWFFKIQLKQHFPYDARALNSSGQVPGPLLCARLFNYNIALQLFVYLLISATILRQGALKCVWK